MKGNELSLGVAGTPYSSLAGVCIILKPGVDGIGVGVANSRRDGVRMGAYPTGASKIRYLFFSFFCTCTRVLRFRGNRCGNRVG